MRQRQLSCSTVRSQGLRSSLWTLMVSKGIQQLMKQAIRFYAERTARANKGWMEALQMHWEIAQV